MSGRKEKWAQEFQDWQAYEGIKGKGWETGG